MTEDRHLHRNCATSRPPTGLPPAIRAALSGLCAVLVGIGLGRFAYTPLVPALIDQGWFTLSETAYIGAANLGGYLVGALIAPALRRMFGAVPSLRVMMILGAVGFFACSQPVNFLWFQIWRAAAGISGGALMVLAAPTALAGAPLHQKGMLSGLVFTGVGLGIAASGTLVPMMLGAGLAETWLALGFLTAALTLLAWRGWPETQSAPDRASGSGALRLTGIGLCSTYALNAAGLVPAMVFLVVYTTDGLGYPLATGAAFWAVFGLGALAGPVAAGRLADRVGFSTALRIALILQSAAVAAFVVLPEAFPLVVASLVTGAFVPGIVPLVLGRANEIAGDDLANRIAMWRNATVAFAAGQAGAAYLFAGLLGQSGDYGLIFGIATGALLAALSVELLNDP